jgi:hypothetical protein
LKRKRIVVEDDEEEKIDSAVEEDTSEGDMFDDYEDADEEADESDEGTLKCLELQTFEYSFFCPIFVRLIHPPT